MRYAKIIQYDVANGEGIRTSLFVSGCNFHCPNCFNEEVQSFDYGEEYTIETKNELIEKLKDERVDGLSILGGDPMWQDEDGLWDLIKLVGLVKHMGKTVWLWTGFKYEDILDGYFSDGGNNGIGLHRYILLRLCDVIVDGLFVEELKDPSLAFRGSSNQRIIDVYESLNNGKVILYKKGIVK